MPYPISYHVTSLETENAIVSFATAPRNIKMSWDSYIDNLIERSKDASGKLHIDKVCIIGLEEGHLWTTNKHPHALQLKPAEGSFIANCFKNRDFTPFTTEGVIVEECYYVFLRELDGNMVLAKRGDGAITMQNSKTAVIIAHTCYGGAQGVTNMAVAAIADYLQGINL